MSAPTPSGKTFTALARLQTIIEAMAGIGSVPVIVMHDMKDLDARISAATSKANPGMFIGLAVVGGKNLDPELRTKDARWDVDFVVEVTANPLLQSVGIAAVDMLDKILDHLPTQTVKANPEGNPVDVTRMFRVGVWRLIRDEAASLLTYNIDVTAMVCPHD